MKLHNPTEEKLVQNEKVEIETDHKGVSILRSKLVHADEFSFEVEDNDGGDPYNSTGKHIVLPDWSA